MVLESLNDDAVRSTLESLVDDLPAQIPREVLTDGVGGPAEQEEGPDIDDLLKRVVLLAEEILVARLGESSG